jgi:hypothetical protein
MTEQAEPGKSLELLVEALVYAPIGLLYEYQEVLPQLVKRGKSQVQLARLLGRAAADRSQGDLVGTVGDVASVASSLAAKLVTDLGAQIGLAPHPPAPTGASGQTIDREDVVVGGDEAGRGDGVAGGEVASGGDEIVGGDAEPAVQPLPIAGYDRLTARELIPLLDELSPTQRDRVRAHEAANRNRKTVLAKLDRLDG